MRQPRVATAGLRLRLRLLVACLLGLPGAVPLAAPGRPGRSGRAGDAGRRRHRRSVGRQDRNDRRPGARGPGARRHRPDHRPGRLGRRLHRLQRLQLHPAAVVDPGHAARRPAGGGQDRRPRPQPHAGAAEGEAAAEAASVPAAVPRERDDRGPVVDRRRPDLRPARAEPVGGRDLGHQSRVGQGDPDRRQDLAQPTTAGRWSIFTAACWACSCRSRRKAQGRARWPAPNGTTPASASPCRWPRSTSGSKRSRRARTCIRACLGVSLKPGDIYSLPAEIAASQPGSPAYKAGVKAGDTIVEIDGHKIVRQVAAAGTCWARATPATRCSSCSSAARTASKPAVELIDKLDPYQHPFLGILPLRAMRPKRA